MYVEVVIYEMNKIKREGKRRQENKTKMLKEGCRRATCAQTIYEWKDIR